MTDQTNPFLLQTPVEEPSDVPNPEFLDSLTLEPDESAPYGYTIDRNTGERRAKKRAGRPSGPKDARPGSGPRDTRPPDKPKDDSDKPKREADRVPGRIKPAAGRRRGRPPKEEREPVELGPFRAGPIAKGVNGLYLKAGRILRVMDHDIGAAVISMTRKEAEDDITVGEAWEELAKVNPRIRATLMRLITGGAWTQLLMAHAPLLMAIVLKEKIRNRLPLMSLLGAFLADEDGVIDAAESVTGYGPPPASDNPFANLTQADLNQAMAFASAMMPGMAGPPRVPTVDDFDVESGQL